MSEITIKWPDWIDVLDECPNCGGAFPDTIPSDSPIIDNDIEYEEGTSEHGIYEEAICFTCGTIIDRHYPNNPDSESKDPLCSPKPWVYRAQFLELNTSLKRRESQVRALKEINRDHSEIASLLGISESTVGEYSRRISQRVENATGTLVEVDHCTGVGDALERTFEDMTLFIHGWWCQSCGDELTADDRAVVILENVGSGWNESDIFCTNCEQEDYQTSVHGRSLDLTEFMDEGRNLGKEFVIIESTFAKVGTTSNHGKWVSENSLKLTDVSLISLLK